MLNLSSVGARKCDDEKLDIASGEFPFTSSGTSVVNSLFDCAQKCDAEKLDITILQLKNLFLFRS